MNFHNEYTDKLIPYSLEGLGYRWAGKMVADWSKAADDAPLGCSVPVSLKITYADVISRCRIPAAP